MPSVHLELVAYLKRSVAFNGRLVGATGRDSREKEEVSRKRCRVQVKTKSPSWQARRKLK